MGVSKRLELGAAQYGEKMEQLLRSLQFYPPLWQIANSSVRRRTPPFHRYHGSNPEPSFQFVSGMSFDHP